ncbi:hypothetical protein PAECIP111891_06715 [Paenibacillus allorhizoplanae]|uniref:Uncharacterized protein n=1 Tax=Paenibacillus allorhizoplanae TaxID=2905648 RepID=A0ABM9CYJ7_9BACL|nr:hypothetical protein [Paenibacillus allorhizoplanae]CAH1230665.1 hypothetical protein PAECIP111891_06715 [Paenibacillus allorhizoplanae]
MQSTSQKFKDKIYAPDRKTKARVTFDISDTTATGDVSSITATSDSPLSVKSQLINKVRNSSYKTATLEQDRFKLDGSFSFADDTLANNGELGWSSAVICDASGVFSTAQTITFNFNSNHSSAGLTITFDQVMGEYATDFDMTAYDASNAVIATTVVMGNTQVIATPLGQLLNYRKVSVIIRKWSKPNRRARVMEVDFGIVKQYTDDNLISINLIEQMDLLSGQLPSAEFRFAVDNSDRAFNILNPTSFYKYLQQKQQVIGEIGVDIGNGVIEYVQIGNYLLQEWQSDEGSLTASFTARTILDSMASFDYENLSASTKTLYQLAVDMFTLCAITNYSIDSALSSINTNSLVKKANCRDILQMIAIAGCANIYVTRDNIITLKCSPSLIGAAVDTADFDNMYNEPQIALDKAVKRVEVTYWTNLSTFGIVGVNSATDTQGDTLKLENNTLINDSSRATFVANWIFAQLKYRATYRIKWQGNPATELNDVLSIENSYGDNMSGYVTRIELDYTGSLKARTEAKGVVN